MKATEMICEHCSRNATEALFRSKGICTSCAYRRDSGKDPLNKPRTPKPHDRNTCACGNFKWQYSNQCVECSELERSAPVPAADRPALEGSGLSVGFDVVRERDKLRQYFVSRGRVPRCVPA